MELILQKVCICCHEERQNLRSLSKCNFTYILNSLLNNKLAYGNYNICDICHSTLIKIDKFKKYVEKNNELLNVRLLQNKHNMQSTKTPFKLCQISNVELTWTSLDQKLEYEIKKEIEIEIEVKVENDSDSKMEPFDISTVDDSHTMEMLPAKKKKPRTQFQANYEGKINIVTISMDELVNERLEEARNKKYLQLPYKCADCIVAFEFEESLNEHMDKKHNATDGSLVCSVCKSVLSTQLSFNEHCKRHMRRYECVECGKRSKNVYPILEHYNEKHGNIPVQYSCKLCDYSTDSNRRYRYHMDKHRTANVQCKECGNTFVNTTGLKNHMRTIHKALARVHACDVCGKRYRRRNSLLAHAQTHTHTHAYCESCDRTFRTHTTLLNHLKMHSKHVSDDVKRYICDECGKKFLKKRSLQDHIDFDHLKNSKYSCDKCSKVFKCHSGLKRHTQYVHEKVRPPRNKMCDHCGRGFTSTSILISHIRTHTGERPLHCTLCPATFAHSAALYTHKKLLHNPKRKNS
ncbi:zinc finger protein 660-like [Zerene cesonia]|uniref:zinc finger protein 660-like n=1 Tax=Zerene cesonia TaxID=33412 RepID=UPI0018E50D39|nr:zinc finger protein 660-like [Zerene cesonia]